MLSRITTPLLFSHFLFLAITASAEPLIRSNDRLAICGDSQTAQLGYSVYIEDYLLMCQPQLTGLEVAEFGWCSPTASDFVTHLDTDLGPFKPSIVMTCFGMFDGGFKPLNDDTADTYRQAQVDTVRALKKSGVRVVILGSPRCVDSTAFRNDPPQAEAYNQTLAALAEIDKQVAAQEGAIYADVFGATLAAMKEAKAQHGESYAYDAERNFERDDKSSLVVAYAFLKALGCDGSIATITADFAASTATATLGQKIVSFDDYKLTVESTRYPFWFPGYPSGDTLSLPILKCVPFHEELNRYLLIVKNLPTASAKITWAGESRDFTAEELGKGVNLASEFPATPFAGHVQDVDNAVRDQQQQERISGRYFIDNKKKDSAGLALRDAARERAGTRFVPVTHTLSINPLAPPEKQPRGPIPVIVDTDMASDCDDAGAVALLNTFMNQGECKLIACVANGHEHDLSSGGTIQAINAWYGHPNIPIGVYHGPLGFPSGSAYTKKTRERFAPDFPTDDKLPDGVDVYRRALVSAADGTVVIASLGFLQNLDDLLKSQSDTVSALAGPDLVRKKVRKLIIMNNQSKDDELVVTTWPTEIIWTMDVGSHIFTGKSLADTPENNPVRFIYKNHGNEQHNSMLDGRQSWDLTASWLAVRGPGELWDITAGGYWKVNTEKGGGEWINSPHTNHGLIMVKMPPAEVSKLIEVELSRAPSADKK
jgi:hypothetical protein